MKSCLPADLPGFSKPSHRNFLYIQSNSPENFREEFASIAENYTGRLPTQGGLMNEESRIELVEAHLSFCGVSYRGDIEGWRHLIESHCNANGKLWATVDENGVSLSDGRRYSWDQELHTFRR